MISNYLLFLKFTSSSHDNQIVQFLKGRIFNFYYLKNLTSEQLEKCKTAKHKKPDCWVCLVLIEDKALNSFCVY